MDYYRFINSKAIREHLQKLQWELTPLQVAWFVWEWEGPMEVRLAAWRQIIEELPDMEIKRGLHYEGCESLHMFLKKAIDIYQSHYETFYDNKNCYYRVSVKYEKGGESEVDITFSECPIKKNGQVLEYVIDPSDRHKSIVFEWAKDYLEEEKVRAIRVDKVPINKVERTHTCAWFNDRNFLEGRYQMVWLYDIDDEWWDVEGVFLDQWFYIPLPFRRGDIIHYVNHQTDELEPMIYEDAIYSHIEKRKSWERYLKGRGCDSSDMCIGVYRMTDGNRLFSDTLWDCTKFDFFDDETAKKYLRGGYNSGERLNTYKQILLYQSILRDQIGIEDFVDELYRLKSKEPSSMCLVDHNIYEKAEQLTKEIEEEKRANNV